MRDSFAVSLNRKVGMTAIEYLNYYRIGVSCDRLRESDTPISEIAIGCGYNNISYFNRTSKIYALHTGRVSGEK